MLSLSTSNESAVRPAWLRLSLTKVFSIMCPLQIFQIHAPTCIWLTTLFEDFSFHFSTRSWRSIIFFNDLFSAITRFDRFEPRLSICGGQSQRAPSSRNCLFYSIPKLLTWDRILPLISKKFGFGEKSRTRERQSIR